MYFDLFKIKGILEQTYDIPFITKLITSDKNNEKIIVFPDNEFNELFEIYAEIKNGIRVILEVLPQKFAADFPKLLQNSRPEQKLLFTEFGKNLEDRGVSCKLLINEQLYPITDSKNWPHDWTKFSLRITKSPLISEDDLTPLNEKLSEYIELCIGMILSLLDIIPLEDKIHYEGKKNEITTNRYERNPLNRKLCLLKNGYTCKICGFNFEKVYGNIGKGFIHVHHIVPVSLMGGEYIINPETDLIPLCPNCHAMIHKQNPPFSPDELRKILDNNKSK